MRRADTVNSAEAGLRGHKVMKLGHLEIIEDIGGGSEESFYLVKNTNSGRYVRLGGAETGYLLEKFDVEMPASWKGGAKLPENFRSILDEKFQQWGFLDQESNSEERKKKRIDLTKIKLVEFNMEKVISAVYPIYSKLFTRRAVIVFAVMLAACAGITAYSVISALSYGDSTGSGNTAVGNAGGFTLTFSAGDIAVTILLLLLSLAAHELAHAVVCKKYGGSIRSMGLMLFFLIPCVYCDVTDVYKIKDRKQRGRVALAGVYVNSFLGIGALLAAFLLTYAGLIVIPLYYFAISSILVSLYNMIPLVKLDGYWYMSAALNVTNLMDKGVLMAYATFFNRKKMNRLKVPAAKRRGLAVYGIASLLFKPVFWGYNIYIISMRLPVAETAKICIICVCMAVMLWDLLRTLKYDYRLITKDYDRLTQMM